MIDDDEKELQTIELHDDEENGNGKLIPDLLREDATGHEIAKAVNGLAVEMQLTRHAISEVGTHIATRDDIIDERLSNIEKMLRVALAAKRARQGEGS